jgi:hypothetical protein
LQLSLRSPLAQGLRDQVVGFISNTGFVQEKISKTLSMIEVGYEHSPIVHQDQSPVFQAKLWTDGRSENPSLRDWLAFGAGPAPGKRVVDVHWNQDDRECRLYEFLHGTTHTLLLFDGAAPTEEGYKNLESIAHWVEERFSSLITVFMVIPYSNRPDSLLWEGKILFDKDGEIHQAYGARSECLYLIRPDKYIGYRCQPARLDALQSYLRHIAAG